MRHFFTYLYRIIYYDTTRNVDKPYEYTLMYLLHNVMATRQKETKLKKREELHDIKGNGKWKDVGFVALPCT